MEASLDLIAGPRTLQTLARRKLLVRDNRYIGLDLFEKCILSYTGRKTYRLSVARRFSSLDGTGATTATFSSSAPSSLVVKPHIIVRFPTISSPFPPFLEQCSQGYLLHVRTVVFFELRVSCCHGKLHVTVTSFISRVALSG